jgi:hypothetical protein
MRILAESDTQRKALFERGGGDVPSHMVKLSFEELMAGRVQPSPHERPKEKERRISVFWLMVEFLAPKVCSAKGWEADMCTIPLQQTNFTASDETMTKLVFENMWQHQPVACCPRKYRNKGEKQVYMAGYQPERNGMVTGGYQSVQ